MSATRYAKSGDVHIAHQVVGEGPRDVVFVPGWVSHVELGWSFPSYAHFLERLASFSRLIIFDKRGTGLSDPVTTTPTLEQRMDDLCALLDEVGSDRVTLLGECEGAPLSVLFAATHPDRVEGLVLYGAMPSVAVESEDPRWIDDPDGRLEQVIVSWGEGRTVELFAPTLAENEDARREMARFERAAASPGMARALLESLREIDVSAAAASVSVPTLVIHRRDDFVPLGPARRLAQLIRGARLVELDGADHALSVGDTEAVAGEIEEFVTGTRRGPEPTRVLLTVLFTDIVGSTELGARLGDASWRQLLDRHHRLVRNRLEAHHGREVKTVGDGFLATFDGPARAVRCAQAIVEATHGLGIELRAGIHTGEVELLGDDIGGMAVNIAARVVSLAGPGEVLATRTVRDLVAGSGISFAERGARELRGVPGAWEILSVEPSPTRPVASPSAEGQAAE